MHIVALVTQKGGSGKSTLAVGLAVAALEQGQRVGLIDADPQGTMASWSGRRGANSPAVARVGSGTEMGRALTAFERDGATLVIIDTAAGDNVTSTSAIYAADLCLIPARPSPADIEAALPTLATIRKLDKPFAFVLCQTPARSYFRLSEAATALNAMGVLALPYIVQRNDHQDALGAGLGVTEFDPRGKAAQEIRELWLWTVGKLSDGAAQRQQDLRAAS
jgi:chromosome partitioning protein